MSEPFPVSLYLYAEPYAEPYAQPHEHSLIQPPLKSSHAHPHVHPYSQPYYHIRKPISPFPVLHAQRGHQDGCLGRLHIGMDQLGWHGAGHLGCEGRWAWAVQEAGVGHANGLVDGHGGLVW